MAGARSMAGAWFAGADSQTAGRHANQAVIGGQTKAADRNRHLRSLAPVQLPVPFQCRPAIAEGLGQPFHQIDRAVLAAGTAYGHSGQAEVVAVKKFEPMHKEFLDMGT